MKGQFIARIAHWLTNEVIVKGLANSTTFQRFVVRTHGSFRSLADRARSSGLKDGLLGDALPTDLRSRAHHWSSWLRDFREGIVEAVRSDRTRRSS